MASSSSLNEFRSCFSEGKDTEELIACVSEILPLRSTLYNVVSVRGCMAQFKATVECKLKENDEETFILEYTKKSNETLRKLTPKFLSTKNRYSKYSYYRCHHKTRYLETMNPREVLISRPSKRFKNTDCPFSLVLRFKRPTEEENEFTATLDIEWTHNHPVQALQALSFKDIPDEVSEEVKSMFTRSYSPGTAYREFMSKIRQSVIDELEFHQAIADRSIVPRRDFNFLYKEYNQTKHGTKDMSSMFENLKG